jgi:hypothetical protein
VSAKTKGPGHPRWDLDSEAYEQSLSAAILVADIIEKAQQYVKRQAHDEADERELLDALGLLS